MSLFKTKREFSSTTGSPLLLIKTHRSHRSRPHPVSRKVNIVSEKIGRKGHDNFILVEEYFRGFTSEEGVEK